MGTGDERIGLRSGDVILYSGQHRLHRLQQERTGCPWAQVGLILQLPGEAGPVVFEATKISPALDVRTGAVVRGVQLVGFAERVALFQGAVAIRRLSPALPGELEARLLVDRFRKEQLPPSGTECSKRASFGSFRSARPQESSGSRGRRSVRGRAVRP